MSEYEAVRAGVMSSFAPQYLQRLPGPLLLDQGTSWGRGSKGDPTGRLPSPIRGKSLEEHFLEQHCNPTCCGALCTHRSAPRQFQGANVGSGARAMGLHPSTKKTPCLLQWALYNILFGKLKKKEKISKPPFWITKIISFFDLKLKERGQAGARPGRCPGRREMSRLSHCVDPIYPASAMLLGRP